MCVELPFSRVLTLSSGYVVHFEISRLCSASGCSIQVTKGRGTMTHSFPIAGGGYRKNWKGGHRIHVAGSTARDSSPFLLQDCGDDVDSVPNGLPSILLSRK